MKQKRFQKKVEDFRCEKCGEYISGGGYTDHCPFCLWSKHVDVNPGDRESECRGLLEPVGAEVKKDGYLIYYVCIKCGFKHRVKSAKSDNEEEVQKLLRAPF
jgi:rubrerythrin